MIELKKAINGEWYFVVKARNKKILLTSETYKRKQNAYKGIRALKKAVKEIKEVHPIN